MTGECVSEWVWEYVCVRVCVWLLVYLCLTMAVPEVSITTTSMCASRCVPPLSCVLRWGYSEPLFSHDTLGPKWSHSFRLWEKGRPTVNKYWFCWFNTKTNAITIYLYYDNIKIWLYLFVFKCIWFQNWYSKTNVSHPQINPIYFTHHLLLLCFKSTVEHFTVVPNHTTVRRKLCYRSINCLHHCHTKQTVLIMGREKLGFKWYYKL